MSPLCHLIRVFIYSWATPATLPLCILYMFARQPFLRRQRCLTDARGKDDPEDEPGKRYEPSGTGKAGTGQCRGGEYRMLPREDGI